MKIAFHTLGCKVNQYESEALGEAFVKRGDTIVSEDEFADVYIVNTCTVTNIADRKSRQFIRRMKAVNPDALMVVTGCYAQVSTEELEAMEGVDLIVGNSLKSEIPDRVYEALESKQKFTKVLSYAELTEYDDMGIVTSSESEMSRAYIKIQEGCNRFCSYCLIPFARGKVRSRDISEIVREAEMLLVKGYREIVLTGINTALYGTEPEFDFDRMPGEEEMSGLEAVVKRLDSIDQDFRIRLSSLEPTVVDIEHIEKIVGYGKLCHHLHLSVQAGSNDVLTAMNRHYSREDYLAIVKALRNHDPLYGITTDIIVGFPGETEENFEDTLRIVDEAFFGRVHAFRYSLRKNTHAAKMGDSIPGNVKADRAGRLEEVATRVQKEFNAANIGTTQKVLCEEVVNGYITGYTDNYIKVYIKADGTAPIGEFAYVRLDEIYLDGCLATIIN